jgi:hypothetical protein
MSHIRANENNPCNDLQTDRQTDRQTLSVHKNFRFTYKERVITHSSKGVKYVEYCLTVLDSLNTDTALETWVFI